LFLLKVESFLDIMKSPLVAFSHCRAKAK